MALQTHPRMRKGGRERVEVGREGVATISCAFTQAHSLREESIKTTA